MLKNRPGVVGCRPACSLEDAKGFSIAFTNTDETVKAFAHYTHNCKKYIYLPYTLQLFYAAAKFSTVLHISNDFHNNLLEKFFQFCV